MRSSLRLALIFLFACSTLAVAQNTRYILTIDPADTPASPLVIAPGETVQFTAKAYEPTAGGLVEVQISTLIWDVEPAAFGTIDGNGLFTAATQNSAPRGQIKATATVGSVTLTGAVTAMLGHGQGEFTFSGTVTSAQGPIAQAEVSVMSVSMLPFLITGRTDAQGNYSIKVPGGEYVVRAAAQGFVPEYYDNVFDPSQATKFVTDPNTTTISGIDFLLGQGGRIEGLVTDAATNNPIAGARVYAHPNSTRIPPSGANTWHAVTDAHGYYQISGLSDGDYYVSAEAQNYKLQYYDGKVDPTLADKVTISGASTASNIDFALNERQPDPVYTIKGTVYDANSTPIAGATVFGEMVGGPMLHWLTARTAKDGTYEMKAPAGTFMVWASAQGYVIEYYNEKSDAAQADHITLSATNPSATGIDFTLGEGGSISGTVIDAATSQPVQGVSVQAFTSRTSSGNPNAAGAYGTTDAQGNYRITGLPTGDYTVQARHHHYGEQYYDGVTDLTLATKVAVIDGQETQNIDFALDSYNGSIAGTVKDAAGNPVADVTVSAWNHRGPTTTNAGGHYGKTKTAADGRYLIDGLAPGDYKVRASAVNYLPEFYDNQTDYANADDVTVANQPVTGIDFSLDQGGSISGTVTDEDNNAALAHAVVIVRSLSQRFERGARTDVHGDYTVHGLPSGDYTVFAAAAGYAGEYYHATAAGPGKVTVAAPGAVTDIDFALATVPIGPRRFTGSVTARTGGQPQHVLVEAINPETGASVRTTTDSRGAFEFHAWDNAIIRARALGYVGMYAGNTKQWKQSQWNGFAGGMTITLDPLATDGMAEIRGTITDASNGNPLAEAWVYGMDAAGQVFFAVTGSDGGYLMENTPNGSLDIMVSEVQYEITEGLANVEDARGTADIIAPRSTVSAVGEHPQLPSTVQLYQNYPNPFNPSTTIRFALPERMNVRLKVFNLLGQSVTTLISESRDAGSHAIEFNAEDLPSGLYLYRLETGTSTITRRMTLMK